MSHERLVYEEHQKRNILRRILCRLHTKAQGFIENRKIEKLVRQIDKCLNQNRTLEGFSSPMTTKEVALRIRCRNQSDFQRALQILIEKIQVYCFEIDSGLLDNILFFNEGVAGNPWRGWDMWTESLYVEPLGSARIKKLGPLNEDKFWDLNLIHAMPPPLI
ncbi:MAG: hypothetical protein WDZ75_01030 [Candidatus Paceibacterota bacterium]